MLKKNFTRKNLINIINQNIGFSKNVSAEIIDSFFESLVSELIKKNKVKITSFGTFEVIKKSERIGRNPKTKELARILPRKIVRFKPSLFIKNKINSLGNKIEN
tara:strand:- start:7694 stop:8005 length:312 start_codon:yes stop_codon:yes gene_type:complete